MKQIILKKISIRNLILFLVLLWTHAIADTTSYYFYKPDIDYGSESLFNPVYTLIDGSYDILRNGAHTKNIFKQPYSDGFNNVMNNISRPIYHIKRYGWNNFVKREIINLSTDVQVSQFMPNIGLHLIGNGMQYVKLYEWYDYHNYPYPKLLSFITTTSYQLINEIVENGSFQGTNVDPISDLLIFNPLGILLFSTNFGKKVFSEKIKLLDWSLMPFYNPIQHSIENAGQQYAAKLSLSREKKYSLFLYWGVISTIGLSCHLNSTDAISFSAGGIVYKLRENKAQNVRYMTPELDYV